MSNAPLLARAFGAGHAESYDRQFARIQAIKEALHLLLAVQLRRLPDDAAVLIAGAGTGAEARHLAAIHPGWRFTLADPAEAMLAVARRHAEAEGFAAHSPAEVAQIIGSAGFSAPVPCYQAGLIRGWVAARRLGGG